MAALPEKENDYQIYFTLIYVKKSRRKKSTDFFSKIRIPLLDAYACLRSCEQIHGVAVDKQILAYVGWGVKGVGMSS